MKNILTFALILMVTITFAQEVKPKFEKQGDLTEATFYHDNGTVAQTGFFDKNNKLEGTWLSYDVKGNKTAVGNYKNGVKVGKWLFWNENSLKEVDYENNKIAGFSEWENKSSLAIAN